MLMAGGVGRIHGVPSGRWFLYCNAVAGGVAAAQAARADFCGDPDVLDKTWLNDTHGIALDQGKLTERLGASSIYTELSLKPFCSAKQAVAAVNAFQSLLGRGISPDAITKVQVRVPPSYAGMISTRAEAGARISTIVSVAHQLGLAALAPEALYDIDRSEPTIDSAVAQFASKVEVAADPNLLPFYPQHWPAEVEVTVGGEVLRQRVVEAVGDPEHPLDADGVTNKGHRVLDPLVGGARATEWLKISGAALDDKTACRALAEGYAAGF
jgi:2-methylcitrate dehydratase PrpD